MNATPGKRWRVAVAGCGGAAFGIHLPTLVAHPQWQVVAVADRDPKRAQQAAARFDIGHVARDTGDLLDGADLLAVLTGMHEQWITCALQAGVHVFTEKPVSLDLERTRRLRRQAGEAGLLLEVGVIRAFDQAAETLLGHVPAAELRGGWLVKADGCDLTARTAHLPPGAACYTFAADPPQQAPADLGPAGRRALEIWLWQGYHLLTVLALAAPHAHPLACTLAAQGDAVFGSVRTPAGAVLSCAVSSAPGGVWLDEAILTGVDATLAAHFPPPYGPADAGSVTVCGQHGDLVPASVDGPAMRMWSAIADRMAARACGDKTDDATGRLAETVERLALGLSYLTVSGAAAPPAPVEVA